MFLFICKYNLLFLLLLPIYALWLLAIGKRMLQKQKKSDKIFTFIASGFFAILAVVFLVAPILQVFKVVELTNNTMILVVAVFYVFWLLTIGYLSNITVRFERESNPETYYSLRDNIDFVKRFFAFFFWFLFFWSYQSTANKLNQ